MKISARNQLSGTVKEVSLGTITAQVILDIGNGQQIVAIISKDSAVSLNLKAGVKATAVIKATEVMIMN